MLGDEKKQADYDQFGKSPFEAKRTSGMKEQGLISARPLILADSEMFFRHLQSRQKAWTIRQKRR